jgi:hypothetical protein
MLTVLGASEAPFLRIGVLSQKIGSNFPLQFVDDLRVFLSIGRRIVRSFSGFLLAT